MPNEEYTIEELESMLNEALNAQQGQEIEDVDQIENEEIWSSQDIEDIVILSNDGYNTLIAHIWKSQTLNKSLIFEYEYTEELLNDTVFARNCRNKIRNIYQYGQEPTNFELRII